MKISAEFNTTEELLSFVGAFSTNALANQITSGTKSSGAVGFLKPCTEDRHEVIENVVKEALKGAAEVANGEIKEVITPKEIETPKDQAKEVQKDETAKEETKGEPIITKEMIRERLGAIMKAGKQKEAKELLASHGASKLPELKEEEYAAVYKEAEELI